MCPTQTHAWQDTGRSGEYARIGKFRLAFFVRCSKCQLRGFRRGNSKVVYVCEQIDGEEG